MRRPSSAPFAASTLLLAAVLAGALSIPPAAAAEFPPASPPGLTPQRTKPARGHEHVAPVDDDLMRSDPANPRILHSKRPGVIDRAWIERTAIPRIPAAVFDDIEAHAPTPTGDRVLQSPDALLLAGAAFAPQLQGRVLVVEGTSNTVVTGQNGTGFNHNNGSFDIINLVLQQFGDTVDFITVFTTFADANVAAYYFPIKQDTDGLGECDFDRGKTFGCLFDQTQGQLQQLQGFVFMNSLATWQDWDRNYDGVVHPFDSFDSAVFSTLGQEVAHRWGSGLRFVDPRTGAVSNKLLGRDGSHWAAFVDTDASVMDGWDWVVDGNRFDLVGDMDRFNTLDLYTLGANPVASAKPFFFIDGARFDVRGQDLIGIDGQAIPGDAVLQLPSDALLEQNGMRIGATGTKVDVTIQDVVDAEGNRCPDPDATQKTFKQAVVLLTRPGQTVAQVQGIVDDLNTALATWEDWWLDRTEKRLKLCTDIVDDCRLAQMDLLGGALAVDGESLQPGSTGTATFTVTAREADVEGAVLRVSVDSDTADYITVDDEFPIGRVAAGEQKTVELPIAIAADYPCGTSAVLSLSLVADNAATQHEELNLFPGYRTIYLEEFADTSHTWGVNADEKDGTTERREGAFTFTDNVELTCDMSKRSPERDASPGNKGAFVTGQGTDHVPNLIDDDPGEGGELDGDTSLWSSPVSLAGTTAPEIRFAYWFDGEEGDELVAQISGDGEKTFVTGKTITESFHGWTVGRVDVRQTLGKVPDKITIRFIATGGGRLEAGIDDVRVLDFDGSCAVGGVGCGCDAGGRTTSAAPLLALVGLAALRGLSRRRHAGRA
jgi:hypothetical protein